MALNNKKKYLFYGVIFGFLFPLLSLFIILFFPSRTELLLLIICTAPLFLGLFALMAGKRQDQLNAINLDLQKIVLERTNRIRNMLDVTGQGFLSFGSDLIVEEDYSYKCEDIFKKKPSGFLLPELLFDNQEQQEDFTRGFSLFFNKKVRSDVVFKLMENEITIDDKIIEVEYRIISEDVILCILSDITLQTFLREKEKNDNKERNIIFNVLEHQKYFSPFIKEAKMIFQSFGRLGEWSKEDYEILQRLIHTFKGNAAFFSFENTKTSAHDFEKYLNSDAALDGSIDLRYYADRLLESYEDELNIILRILGEKWLNEIDHISIPYSRYIQLEEHIIKRYGKENNLSREIQQFRKIPLTAMMTPFPHMSKKIADSLGKNIKPLVISGDEFLILPEHYEDLVSSFVHMIRNTLVHGIEIPSERRAKNKSEVGEICISIESADSGMVICFTDDGRGISYQEVEEKAKRMGILPLDKSCDSEDLLELIFTKGLSTSKDITEFAGRGTGLWAVKNEVNKLKGRITVKTTRDKGTFFIIWLPIL